MTRLEELNVEWIGICNLMQILNRQRLEVYNQWLAEMERQGHHLPDDEFPLKVEKHPSLYFDLNQNPIDYI